MKVIDLLNKIANGEINEDTLIEFDNGYKDYCTVRVFFDRYIMDRENLNCEVKVKEEDKKIEKVNTYVLCDYDFICKDDDNNLIATNIIDKALEEYSHKINEIIDKINEME